MNVNVDAAYENAVLWREEARALRTVLLSCDVEETFKWGKPCYAKDGKNLAIVQRMKGFLALMFFKGALLKDPDGVLESQGENSRSALRICFRSVDDVKMRAGAVTALIKEAIAVEQAGLSAFPPRDDLQLVEELQARLDTDPTLRAAFDALTPGRRRGYNLHISSAKQTKTRLSRIEACAPKILAGKGLRD